MSDLFHPEVPDAFIFAVFEVIRRADRHTFQVLTKRPERAAQLSPKLPWPDNLWMGTTVEKQRYVDRIKPLLMTGARVKFLSCEPLIGPLRMDLSGIHWVIVGGESGPRARPMRVEWARDIRGQCEQDQALFFFKQWGSHGPDGRYVGRKRAGRLLDGRTWDGMPPLLAAQARAFL
jgi:protein gp37